MQPVADRAPRRVLSFVCGVLFSLVAMLSVGALAAQAVIPDSQPLRGIALELKRSDAQQAALLELLHAQQTPGSAEYRKWLTPEQFADRFAPNQSARQAAAEWLEQQGFQVSGSARNGMRVEFRGTAAQVQRAFSFSLQAQLVGNALAVSIRPGLKARLPLTLAARTVRLSEGPSDPMATLVAAVDENTGAAVALPVGQAAAESVEDWQELLAEAAAQGITVVQVNSGGLELADASAAVLAAAPGSAQANGTAENRPNWQAATGLPANGLRMVPDALLSDASTLVQALNASAVQHGRFGALAPQLYRLAAGHGVFSHADTTVAAGTWTLPDGLGTVNVPALLKALVTGTTGVNVALATSDTTITHGQTLGLSYTVTATGGTPTGTVTATLKGRNGGTVTLGPSALNATGVATFTAATLPGDVYDVSGSYSGDSTFATGTSNIVTSTVSPEAVALTATAPTTAVGAMIPVTVTATSTSGVGVPSGAVTVTAYGASASDTPSTYSAMLPSSTGASASAVVNVPATSVGKFTFQANCTSNGSFACNTPTSFAVAVTPESPTVTLTSTPQAVTANSATQKYDLAVSVASSAGTTATTPTGTVAIQNNGTPIATVTLNKGAGAYTVSLSGTGNSLVAAYGGDTNYAAATSAAVVVNAPLVTTTTVLTGSPTSINFGSATALTASVTPASYAAAGSPTGTITYRSSLQGVFATATLGAGYVTYTAATLQVGSHSITATYSGDSVYATSVSTPVTVSVAQGKASTATTLSVTPTQPLAGQNTTLTVTVTPSFPVPAGTPTPSVTCTGQVTFFSNNAFVANGPLIGGMVSVTAKLPLGSDSLTAMYAGDTQCYGSTSAALVVSPAKVASAFTLQPSVSYANAGQTIQLTATVTGADVGTIGLPTGTVIFYDTRGGIQVTIGTALLTASGTTTAIAAINTNGSSAGQHTFSATYSGDGIFLPATSAQAVVFFGDFSLSVNPSNLTIPQGGSSSAIATLAVSNGFNASVVLTCTPPGTSQITCSFLSSTLTGGGSTGLTVTTTPKSSKVVRASRTPLMTGAGTTLAALLLLPFARTRRLGAALLLVCVVTFAGGGCGLSTVDSTNNLNGSSGTGSSGSTGTGTGTPLGTQLLTITVSSSDGTLRHSYTYPVAVQ